MTKAFDTVDHLLLPDILVACGIREAAGYLIRSYSSGGLQRVFISSKSYNRYSKIVNVRQGVPQGSILGSLLSLLYSC